MGIGAVSTVIIDAHRHFRYRSADVGVRARPARRAERDEPRPPEHDPRHVRGPRTRPHVPRLHAPPRTGHGTASTVHTGHDEARATRTATGTAHTPTPGHATPTPHRRGSPYGFARAQAACVSESNLKVLQVLSVLLRASYAAIRPPRGIKDAWAQPPLCLLPRPDIRHALCSRRGLLCWMLGARLV